MADVEIEKLRGELSRIGMGSAFDHPLIFLAKVYAGLEGETQLQPRLDGSGVERVTIPAPIKLRVECAAKVAEWIEAKPKSVETEINLGITLPPLIDYRTLPNVIELRPMPKGANGNGHKKLKAPRVS